MHGYVLTQNVIFACETDAVSLVRSSTRGGDSFRGSGSPGARLAGANPDEMDPSGQTPEQGDGGAATCW